MHHTITDRMPRRQTRTASSLGQTHKRGEGTGLGASTLSCAFWCRLRSRSIGLSLALAPAYVCTIAAFCWFFAPPRPQLLHKAAAQKAPIPVVWCTAPPRLLHASIKPLDSSACFATDGPLSCVYLPLLTPQRGDGRHGGGGLFKGKGYGTPTKEPAIFYMHKDGVLGVLPSVAGGQGGKGGPGAWCLFSRPRLAAGPRFFCFVSVSWPRAKYFAVCGADFFLILLMRRQQVVVEPIFVREFYKCFIRNGAREVKS